MKKVIVIILVLLVLVGVGYWLIPNRYVDKKFTSESIDLIPNDAFLIFKSNQPQKTFQQLFESKIGGALLSFKDAQLFYNQISSLDSLINNNSITKNNLISQNLLLSAHKTGVNSKGLLVVIKVKNHKEFDLLSAIERTKLFRRVSDKIYDEQLIVNAEVDDDFNLSFTQFGNIIAVTTSSILAEQVVRHKKHGKSLAKQNQFKKLYRTSDELASANVFINFNEVGGFLQNLQSKNTPSIANRLDGFGDWMEMDLRAKDDNLMFNGFSYVGDSSNTYLQSFSSAQPQKLMVASILPNNTSYFAFQGIGEFSSFYKNYRNYLDKKQLLYEHEKNIKTINKRYGMDVKEDVFSWIGSDVCAFITTGKQEDLMQNFGVAIHFKDIEIAEQKIEEIIKKTNGNLEVESFSNYKIGNLNLTNLMSMILGDFYSGLTNSYFVIIEDYLILANDVGNLKNIINSYRKGATLVKDMHFNKFMDNLSDQSNYLIYLNFKRSESILNNYLSEELYSQIETVQDSVKKLEGFAIQWIHNPNLFFTNAYINYNVIEENQVVSLIETKLDTSYRLQPWVVKNHYTKERELLVQDLNNKLYLVNNVGKILWKKQLKNQIVGEVFQVDRYKNDKLQYAFGTGEELHLIDRLGNDVEGFPVKLKNKQTKGIAVLDYDKNRNYRVLVPSNNQIFNYSIEGKIVSGWDFEPGNHKIAAPPKLLQVNKKDYIVVVDYNGKVRLLSRRGNDRIQLNSVLPENRDKYEIMVNNSLSNSMVFSTDTSGTLYLLKLTDELETIVTKLYSSNHQFYLSNINLDKSKDVAYFDEGKIFAYKLTKKLITEIEGIDFNPTYGVHFHQIEDNIIITVNDPETGKVYAYDNNGDLYDNFPMDGSTPALVIDLDYDGRNEFIIGDSFGSIYFYKIF